MACILTSIIKCWLEKIRFCTSRNSTHKMEKCRSHGIRKTVFHYWTLNKQKHPFISSYLKIPFSPVKRLDSFAWNLHLEMTCLPPRPLSFCFQIPFFPSAIKPGSIKNWQTMVSVQRLNYNPALFCAWHHGLDTCVRQKPSIK